MTSTTPTAIAPPSSLAGWQRRSLHTVTCPSGQRLRIRLPGIPTLLEHGDLPDDLIEIALLEVSRRDGAAGAIAEEISEMGDDQAAAKLERLAEFARFQKQLVCAAIQEIESDDRWEQVELTPERLDGLPEDDLAMVAEIVQRLRGSDARGVRIGVEPLDRWARFRDHHSCGEGCEACEALVRELSSADVGAL